jgi:Ca2+-binding EF-hand superfamily protein
MIRLSTLAAAVAAAALLAVPAALAQDAPKKDRTEAMFKKLDANGDEVIEKVEYDAPRVKLFERIDKDKDGRITLTEVEVLADKRAKRADWSDEKKAKWIAHLGVKTPQGLTREEFLGQKSSFTRIDVDGDGKLTVTEVKVYSDKLAERRAKRAAKQGKPDAPTTSATAPAPAAAGAVPASEDADDADLDPGMDADDGTDG